MKTIKTAVPRSNENNPQLIANVAGIIDNVRRRGDAALKEYNLKFDGCRRKELKLSSEEIKQAYAEVSDEEINNMKKAAANIMAFALAQKKSLQPLKDFQPSEGIFLGHNIIPVNSCCCYIPGGSYPLYSTALMLAIPAKTAGVKRVAACSPCMKNSNKINSKTVVAMDIAGVDEIYALGGAQSIAAFSYGTDMVPPVDMIVGPGNQFVTEAKRQCYGRVGIDFIAGPSEVLAIIDETAIPEIVAADMLAQSEHDLIAKGIVVSTCEKTAKAVIEAVAKQLETLETAGIAAKSWESYGEVILADNLDEAVKLANEYAPEHLEVIVSQPDKIIQRLKNYGSLFIGQGTAEVFGDYASGTNHTLPTLKASRYTGGVWVGMFLKVCTYQHLTKEAMKDMAPLVSSLAQGEGLMAHARAADIRSELLK